MVVAAAAALSHSTHAVGLPTSVVPSKHIHANIETLKLQQKLTNVFPAKEDIKFDKDLDLLMLDGYAVLFNNVASFSDCFEFPAPGRKDG